MSDREAADKARLDALMFRMLGALLLLGATMLGGLALLLAGLPRVVEGGGTALVLPGTQGRHSLSALAIPVLLAGGLFLGLPGCAAFLAGRAAVPFGRTGVAAGRPRRRARPVLILLGGLVVLAAVLLRR